MTFKETNQVMDQVRDLHATIAKLTEDRDMLARGEQAADRYVDQLTARLAAMTEERDEFKGYAEEFNAERIQLLEAGTSLYEAGHWELLLCDMSQEDQAREWEDFRDALGRESSKAPKLEGRGE